MQRFLSPLLLAAFLVFAQAGLWTHALQHLSGGRAAPEKQLPPDKVCEQCVAQAPLGAGLTAKPPILPVPVETGFSAAAAGESFSSRFLSAPQARAPPAV